MAPEDAGPFAVRLAERAAPARVSVAYPGLWLRDDVYAIHGHYSDLHTTVPTFERLAAGAMARWVVHLPDRRGDRRRLRGRARAALRVDAHARPALRERRADRRRRRLGARVGRAGGGGAPRASAARRGARRRLRGRGRRASTRSASARSTATSPARRCAAAGSAACARCCGASASPRRGCCSATRTAPARGRATTCSEWTTAGGTRLINTGSWCYQPHFLSAEPNRSPYWPGTAIRVGESGPPELIRLLGDRGHDELRPPLRAAPA